MLAPRGAPEILHAISCPNIWSYMLPWLMTFARGMYLLAHHLVCGCCITLSVAYFCAAAGRQGWLARVWQCGLWHDCCGLGVDSFHFSSIYFVQIQMIFGGLCGCIFEYLVV